jgi:hypothetical protein
MDLAFVALALRLISQCSSVLENEASEQDLRLIVLEPQPATLPLPLSTKEQRKQLKENSQIDPPVRLTRGTSSLNQI